MSGRERKREREKFAVQMLLSKAVDVVRVE